MKKDVSLFIIISLIAVIALSAVFFINFKVSVGNGHYIKRVGIQNAKGYESRNTWYQNIPEEILDTFEEEGLYVIYEGYGTYSRNDGSVGYISFNDDYTECGDIHIRNDGKFDDDLNFTICHEFGHYFDYILGRVSQSDEWKEITEEEIRYSQSCLVSTEDGSYYADPAEFFAQEFAYYVMGGVEGDYEAISCEKAQAYIEKLINNYCD